MRPIGTAEELERRRRRAVELVKRGESPAKVAYFLGCGRSSVYTWLKADRQAAEDLAARPHPGPRPRLTEDQVKELDDLLRKGATAHGWPNALWTAQRVAEMIRRHFGVEYHVEHARKVIRRRLRWSSQVPQKKAKQRNDEKVAH
jgi:transposase